MHLEALGWSAFFENQWTAMDREIHRAARVAEERKNSYWLFAEGGEFLAEVSGKLRHQAAERSDLPAVGDWVAITSRSQERRATIHRVLDRRSKFSRKTAGAKTSEQIVATNVDTVFLVSSLNADLNLRRIERYLTLAWESGARPVILLNKADLCNHAGEEAAKVESISPGVEVHVISALAGQGVQALERHLREGQTIALLGSSGVGKSTLVNRLAGAEIQHVREIRHSDDRGKHATSSRQLILLPKGAILLDTPGMRELQLWDAEGGWQQTFQDIDSLAKRCHFRNCKHDTEPGCAVRQALSIGTLDLTRFESYAKLQRELAYLARKQDHLAMLAEKKKWKKIHREIRRSSRQRKKGTDHFSP